MTGADRPWLEDRPEVRSFTEPEAAWLAGVIDGEGSIGLYDFGKQGRRVEVQMANTSEAFVARMREIIGCGSTVYRRKAPRVGGHKGEQPMFQYSLRGSLRCYKVLRQVEPFLIIKQGKAREIIAELEGKPFGRWANCDPEARRRAGERKREWWASLTPGNRAEVIAKMVANRRAS